MNSARSPVTRAGERGRLRRRRRRRPSRRTRCCRGCARRARRCRRDLGDDVRRGLRAQVAEHPFDVAGGGEPAAARAVVAQHQERELHRRVERDEHRQLAVRCRPRRARTRCSRSRGACGTAARLSSRESPGRQRGRRPDLAALLVAQVERLAAGVARPGRCARASGGARARSRTRCRRCRPPTRRCRSAGWRHVDPRRRRPLRRRVGRDHVLAAVGREAADAVEEQSARCVSLSAAASPARGLGRARGRRARGGRRSATRLARHLLGERAAASLTITRATACSSTRSSAGDLLGVAHEDAARAVEHVRFEAARRSGRGSAPAAAGGSRALLVPDHQVDRQALEAPLGVRLHQLPHEVDVAGIADLQQHDRQVAGDRVAPQPRLAAPVAQQHARRRRAASAARRRRCWPGARRAARRPRWR